MNFYFNLIIYFAYLNFEKVIYCCYNNGYKLGHADAGWHVQ